MDVSIIVAGLSPNIRVFDAAVFSPAAEVSGADPMLNPGGDRDVHMEMDGYVVTARHLAAWDVVVDALLALHEHRRDAFHRVMRGCRKLSNAGKELDGLDDLLADADQARFELSSSREQRRDRLGFLSSEEARAFLDAARRVPLDAARPHIDPLWLATQRSFGTSEYAATPPGAFARAEGGGRDDMAPAMAHVIEVLRGAGVLADAPRGLLPGARAERRSLNTALEQYLRSQTGDDPGRADGEQELAFVANVLMAAGSLQSRPFTRREAKEAAAATCNLGLEYLPRRWGAPETHDLVTVFQAGWVVLHRDVSMPTCEAVLHALDRIHSADRDLQIGLHGLRRRLRESHQARTPWRPRARLDVLASLDLPAWAALTALLDEYPVMLSNVSRVDGRPPLTVNPSEFQFIATAGHIAAVHEFLGSLTDLLTR